MRLNAGMRLAGSGELVSLPAALRLASSHAVEVMTPAIQGRPALVAGEHDSVR